MMNGSQQYHTRLVSGNANTLNDFGAFLRHAALRRFAMVTAMVRWSALPGTTNRSRLKALDLRDRALARCGSCYAPSLAAFLTATSG